MQNQIRSSLLTHFVDKEVLALVLSRITFLKTTEKIKIYEKLDNVQDFTLFSIVDISTLIGRKIVTRLWHPETIEQRVLRDLSVMRSYGIRFVPYWDSAYPPLLREIYDPPFALFVRGQLPPSDNLSVAIVGTRLASNEGMKAAQHLACDLATQHVSIISGLARGIDGSAHRGAVRSGGYTAAVLACGLDRIYPQSHATLAAQIIESGGGIIAEYAPEVPALKQHFVQRNRLISGLAQVLVVCEAPDKSGSLITASYALEQGRDVAVHRCALSSPVGEGTSRLVQEGAPLVSTACDIMSLWNDLSLTKSVAVEQKNIAQREFDWQ